MKTISIAAGSEYQALLGVFSAAFNQASEGKGKDRHANSDEPFEKQKICEITRRVGLGFPLGQAIKKAEESLRLGHRGPAEILGAINYLAAAYIVLQEETNHPPIADDPFFDAEELHKSGTHACENN